MATQKVSIETAESGFSAAQIRSFIRLLPDYALVTQTVTEDRYTYATTKKVTKLQASWELTPD
jgi:hypothetical protein